MYFLLKSTQFHAEKYSMYERKWSSKLDIKAQD